MKTLHAVGLAAVAVVVTIAIEESRIAALRQAVDPAAPASARSMPGGTPSGVTSAPSGGAGSATKAARRPETAGDSPEADDGSLGKTVRKMWDNPAGKAMMNQGVKIAVAMMYEDFIEGLGLTKEEKDYFKTLLGKDMADQQEIGMKLMSASAAEREELTAELEARKAANKEEIRKFLNSDEDFQRYTDYQDRLPERQQLDGIRATFATQGATLDEATETRLVEAMFRSRTEADTPDFLGPDAFGNMGNEGMVEKFEESWATQEANLMKEAATILDEPQLAAFREYRDQMKEMQLMGIKMAEKMMQEGDE
ncbi:hypothetical protein [Luteolibacter marinus]|uniref:hypothetical protein n=1 Tax=Luteolibacter marinus TaxID=2776705 RepID=UPI0018695A0F|nr:hypothetical protein [Luteolibacter marinus]